MVDAKVVSSYAANIHSAQMAVAPVAGHDQLRWTRSVEARKAPHPGRGASPERSVPTHRQQRGSTLESWAQTGGGSAIDVVMPLDPITGQDASDHICELDTPLKCLASGEDAVLAASETAQVANGISAAEVGVHRPSIHLPDE